MEKLLIVDDEKMLTELLFEHFTMIGYTTDVANDAAEALSQLKEKPNLILLDVNMPDMDGITLCRHIREHVNCPILFLTANVTEQDKVMGLNAGGDDYITKPFSLTELTARVEAHLRREQRNKTMPTVLFSQDLVVNLTERKVLFHQKEIKFSKKEFDVIAFLLIHANQVFEKETIYERVWGLESGGDSNVIKEHIRKIRSKLLEVTGKDYIETIWGMGYKWKK